MLGLLKLVLLLISGKRSLSDDDSDDEGYGKRPCFGSVSVSQPVVTLQDSLQTKSSANVSALASSFIKTDTAAKTSAVYNDVSKKLMVSGVYITSAISNFSEETY